MLSGQCSGQLEATRLGGSWDNEIPPLQQTEKRRAKSFTNLLPLGLGAEGEKLAGGNRGIWIVQASRRQEENS